MRIITGALLLTPSLTAGITEKLTPSWMLIVITVYSNAVVIRCSMDFQKSPIDKSSNHQFAAGVTGATNVTLPKIAYISLSSALETVSGVKAVMA